MIALQERDEQPDVIRSGWKALLLPPLVASLLLFAIPQAVFLRMSFYEDLGMGRVGPHFQLGNYIRFVQDPFYLRSLGLTTYLSTLVVGLSLLLGFPVAYVLARMQSRWALALLAVIVMSSFITVAVKVLGLIVFFSANGPMNRLLIALGVVNNPIQMLGNRVGVVIGLLHYALPFAVLVFFSVIQTIPRSLEDAAQIHGASRWRVIRRVVIPLSLPGLIAGSLMIFNICMGAFTSAAILGGGRVLTLPVLIQRTFILETQYGMAAAISAALLLTVLLINLVSVGLVSRLTGAKGVAI